MRLTLIALSLMLANPALAQQSAAPPAGEAAATASPAPPSPAEPAPSCAKDDALCIMAEKLKKQDPSVGSRSDPSRGYIARQPPPDMLTPGGRIDLQFLGKYRT